MKKSTKSEKPAAPQVKKTASTKAVGTKKAAVKKAAAPVATPPAAKVSAVAPKTVAPTKVVAKTAVVKKAPAKKVAAKTATAAAPKPVVSKTVITAKIDVGFGNALHLRGEGPGLSWDSGVALECVSDSEWSITLTGATAPVVFKFLINDLNWSTGEDFVVEAGSSVVLEPLF